MHGLVLSDCNDTLSSSTVLDMASIVLHIISLLRFNKERGGLPWTGRRSTSSRRYPKMSVDPGNLPSVYLIDSVVSSPNAMGKMKEVMPGPGGFPNTAS
jgi:hypothetical protein